MRTKFLDCINAQKLFSSCCSAPYFLLRLYCEIAVQLLNDKGPSSPVVRLAHSSCPMDFVIHLFGVVTDGS